MASDKTAPPTSSTSSFSSVFSPLTSSYSRFSEWRSSLGLSNPGTAEGLTKEINTTHLTNFMFDGARADITKTLSMDPAFQVTHSFTLGAQQMPPAYNFGAAFVKKNMFLQGGMDHDGSLNARFHRNWSASNTTKVQASLANSPGGHNMIRLDHDYQGLDYSANFRAMNPSPVDLSGMYIGNYLQSVTKNLALGIETLYHRPAPNMVEVSSSYLMKYTSSDKDWIATAQVQPAGILQATYWHKLSESVHVAADLQLIAAPSRRDAVATVGARWNLRQAEFKAQIDSTGKVSALLEQRFAPTLAFMLAGEIDHFKNAAKVGVGIMIESTTLTPEEMGMPPPPPQ